MGHPSESGSGYTAVDPGQIRKFAELLDAITTEIADGPKKTLDTAPTKNEMFGAFNQSSTHAQAKHDDLVTDSRTFWRDLHAAFADIAKGTHEVATRYSDLSELNQASSSDVNAALAAGRKA